MAGRKTADGGARLVKAPDLFWVYVIEIDNDALAEKDRQDTGKGVVYVGYTSTSPEERLAKHQAAKDKAGRVFKRMTNPHLSRLRSDLALYAGPWVTKDDALRNEKRMHNRLVSDGYKVFGDRGKTFMAKPKNTNAEA